MTEPAGALATFEHPGQVYQLRYPAHWDHLVQDAGRSCGFGPRDRDDVGLWISILPARLDTAVLGSHLRELFAQVLGGGHWGEVREDPSLRSPGLKADSVSSDNAGHAWLIAGGDVVLFASSQVPAAERDAWTGPFDRLMASLEITRDAGLFGLRVTQALLARLRERFPGREYAHDEGRIRAGDVVISPGSLIRQVRAAPHRQDELIDHFITGLVATGDDAPAAERLDAVRDLILPVLKSADYVKPEGPTVRLARRAWLGDVVICYSVRGARTLRFVMEPDLERWGLDEPALHQLSMANLARLPLPEHLEPAGDPTGRVVILNTGDNLDATRLLAPGLHNSLAPVLGSPFYAAVPDRDTLSLFAVGDRELRARLVATLREQHRRAAYPVSAELFLVGPDGVALAER